MSRLASAAVRIYSMLGPRLPLRSRIGRALYSQAYFAYKRILEDPYAALLRSSPDLLRGGDVIDAGANIGYTARLFARHVDEGRIVHAFEPDSASADLLEENTRDHPAVRVHRAALGAQRGKVSFWHNPGHPADHRVVAGGLSVRSEEMSEVALVTGDEIVAGRAVAFIKIDVQGYELQVSLGLAATIERNERIAVSFELAPSMMRELGSDAHDLLDFYAARGFSFFLLQASGTRRPISPSAVMEAAERAGYVDVLCRRTAAE